MKAASVTATQAVYCCDLNLDGRRQLRLTGLSAQIVRLIALHADELAGRPTGRLEVFWEGKTVSLYLSQKIASQLLP